MNKHFKILFFACVIKIFLSTFFWATLIHVQDVRKSCKSAMSSNLELEPELADFNSNWTTYTNFKSNLQHAMSNWL